jgi:hypothetical protein
MKCPINIFDDGQNTEIYLIERYRTTVRKTGPGLALQLPEYAFACGSTGGFDP